MNTTQETFPLRKEISVATCPACNKQFRPRRLNQKYCSAECRVFRNNQVIKRKYQRGFSTSIIEAENVRLRKIADMPRIVKVTETNGKVSYNGQNLKRVGGVKELLSSVKVSPLRSGGILFPVQNKIIYRPIDGTEPFCYELE